jgi:hypothetical protein
MGTTLAFSDSIILGYDASSLGNRIPTFRENIIVVPSSTRVFSDLQIHENECSIHFRNVKNRFPRDT